MVVVGGAVVVVAGAVVVVLRGVRAEATSRPFPLQLARASAAATEAIRARRTGLTLGVGAPDAAAVVAPATTELGALVHVMPVGSRPVRERGIRERRLREEGRRSEGWSYSNIRTMTSATHEGFGAPSTSKV